MKQFRGWACLESEPNGEGCGVTRVGAEDIEQVW
jgi:hypothetical protein